jgi:hypothetical protein
MTIFYAANPRGFYDDADFGPRTLMVPDPQWIHPTQSIKLLPGESIEVGGEVVVNSGKRALTVPNVLDDSAVHPLICVDNPACRIPVDAVPISKERHLELLDGQSAGQLIREDAQGHPILVDLPAPTDEQLTAAERAWRFRELLGTDQLVARHRDEHEEGASSTLTTECYAQLQGYRRALRDWPDAPDFPDSAGRPEPPDWLYPDKPDAA